MSTNTIRSKRPKGRAACVAATARAAAGWDAPAWLRMCLRRGMGIEARVQAATRDMAGVRALSEAAP